MNLHPNKNRQPRRRRVDVASWRVQYAQAFTEDTGNNLKNVDAQKKTKVGEILWAPV